MGYLLLRRAPGGAYWQESGAPITMALTQTREPGVVILGAGPTGLGAALGLALNGYRRIVPMRSKTDHRP